MSQQTVEQQNSTEQEAGDTQAAEAAKGGSQQATDDPGDDLEKWKALARKHEARAASNAEAAKKLAEIEEANKTELQKANERAEAAEKKAAESERKAFAAKKGIPASLIHGTTEEEWEASAKEALEWKGAAKVAPSADGQGKVGTDVRETKEMSADEIVAAVTRR